MSLDLVEGRKRVGAGLLNSFKKGIFWVVFGVLIVAVSSTAQAPKSPTPSQSASEVGRYAFWSVPKKDGGYEYGFFDTKRGRVWIYTTVQTPGFTPSIWLYSDLNEAVIQQRVGDENRLYREFIKEALNAGRDTLVFSRERQNVIRQIIQEIREKEK